jgi:hypothetical protein
MPDALRHKPLVCKLALTVLFVAAVIITDPRAPFPLNDDWAWAKDVFNILHGDWRYTGWEAMPLLPQALLGALVCSVGSFDFTLLRLLTLALCLVVVSFLFDSLFLLTKNALLAGLACLLFLFNPLAYALSFSFMTDIPFLAILAPSLYFFLKYVATGQEKYFHLSLSLCCLAALQRQLAVVVGLGYALALAAGQGVSRATLPRLILAGLGPYLALAGYESLLSVTGTMPHLYTIRNAELAGLWQLGPGELLSRLAKRFLLIVYYCGFFFFPLVLAAFFSATSSLKRRLLFLALSLAACAGGYLAWTSHMPLPFRGNILNPSGVGPLLLKDTYLLGLPNFPTFSWTILLTTTVMGVVSGAFALAVALDRILETLHDRSKDLHFTATVLFFGVFMLYSGITTIFAGFYDRYILINCFFVPLLLFSGRPFALNKPLAVTALLWILLLAGFSVTAEKDYLDWNRAKWHALSFLEQGLAIGPERIDGGFEYNASLFFHPEFASPPGKSWWWVKDDAYLVAFGPVPGFDAIKAFPYPRRLFGDQGHILVLKRQQAAP